MVEETRAVMVVVVAGASLGETASVLGTAASTGVRGVFQPAVVNSTVNLFSSSAATTTGALGFGGGGLATTATMPSLLPHLPLFAAGAYGIANTIDQNANWHNTNNAPKSLLPVFNIRNSGASLLSSGYNLGMMGAGSLSFDMNPQIPDANITLPPQIKLPTVFSTPNDRDKINELTKNRGFTPIDPEFVRAGLTETFPAYQIKLKDSTNVTPAHKQPHWSDHILFQKQYPDTVDKINNRYPINADYAGKQYPLPEALKAQYPDGLWFKDTGYPDFTPHVYKDQTGKLYKVEVDGLTGLHVKDFDKANKAMGIKELPEGYTWHHVEDGKTMEAIPTGLHSHIKHTGGAANLRGKK